MSFARLYARTFRSADTAAIFVRFESRDKDESGVSVFVADSGTCIVVGDPRGAISATTSTLSRNLEKEAAPTAPPTLPRRKRIRWAMVILAAVLTLARVVDGFFIEPYWIESTHYEIQGAVAAPLKIAQLSDLHTRGVGRRERRLLEILLLKNPT